VKPLYGREEEESDEKKMNLVVR